MLRKLFLQMKQPVESGFALPTVMIVAVVMMIILVTAVQASASVRTALSNQYYNNLANEAAEAGAMFANACIQKANGYASWNQLQPNTDCSGQGINGVASRYLVNQSDMRSTFTVSYNNSSSADQYNLIVNGSVQLLRKSAPDTPWKTINVKRKTQVQPCTKTITNMIPNPSFEVDTSGWSAAGANIARTTNAGGTANTDGSYTLLVQSTGSNESYATATTPLVPGKTYTVSGVIYIPAGGLNTSGAHGRRASIAIFYINTPTGAYRNDILAQAPNTTAGYQRVSYTFSVPTNVSTADANAAFLRLYNGATSGDVYWDSVMLAEDDKDTGFKDGDTAGWAWNGAYNNATSTGPVKTACTSATACTFTNMITNPNLETSLGSIPTSSGVTANTWEPVNASIARDNTTWATNNSNPNENITNTLKITPSSGSNGDSFASIGGDSGGIRLGMQAGKTYSITATMRVPQNLTGTVYLPWRRGVVVHTYTASSGWTFYTSTPYGNYQYPQSSEATNTTWNNVSAGTYKLRTTFTVPINATNAFVRLYNGGKNGEPAVLYDNVAMYEGTRSPYYDGSSPGWSWSGSPNLSSSSGPIVPCGVPVTY